MRHNKKGEKWTGVNPENYRIKDDIEFYLEAEEQTIDGKWKPYQASDLQLEFVRLDPFYRVNLKQGNPKSTTYSISYKVPDTLGVYKFMIQYWRYGYTFIDE